MTARQQQQVPRQEPVTARQPRQVPQQKPVRQQSVASGPQPRAVTQPSARRREPLPDDRIERFGLWLADWKVTSKRIQPDGNCFYNTSLSRTCGAEKKKVSDRTVGRIQSCQKHLVNLGHLLNRVVLTDDPTTQVALEVFGV